MRRLLSAAVLVLALAPGAARAGVTIHYEGAVRSDADRAGVIADATAYAKARGWPVEARKDGVVLRPHARCEPVELLFDGRALSKSFAKTQFAGPEIHIAIVELFRSVRPRFAELEISDEGEYWDGSDREKLIERMQSDGLMMVRLAQRQPGSVGPFVIPEGRIVDLVAGGPGGEAAIAAEMKAAGARPLDAPFVTPRPWRPDAKPLAPVPAARWTAFEAKEERFAASFPGTPERKALERGGVRYRVSQDRVAYTVIATPPVEGAGAAETLADLAPALAQHWVGKILADRTETRDGATVRTLSVVDGDSVAHLRMVIAGNRPYVLRVSAEQADVAEADVRMFFESFRALR